VRRTLAVLTAFTLAEDAWACASCACGDPTIAAMGTEQPMPGRVRLSLVAGWREERTPSQTAEVPFQADEIRFDLTAAGAIGDRVWLSGTLPVLSRGIVDTNLERARSVGWGDAELRARVVLFRPKGPRPRHQFGLSTGLVVPTALRVREAGDVADDDLQPGAGAISPMLGLFHGWTRGMWSGFSSLTGRVSFLGWDQRTPGPVGLISTAVQVQPIPEVSPRLQLDGRLSATHRIDGEPEGIGGGWMVAVTPSLWMSPTRAVTLFVEVRVPVAQRLQAGARETVHPSAGVAVEL